MIANTRSLTLQQQDRLLRREWPFRTILMGTDLALWRGRVYGLSQGYEVSILYVRRHFQQGFEYAHAWFPEVRVLAPRIERRVQEPLTPIPHVYDEANDPNLCLFDPAFGGWDSSQAIAFTTLPWIAEWLRFYEAWQATGVWQGGGREHTAGPRLVSQGRYDARLDRRVFAASGMVASRLTLAAIDLLKSGPIDRRAFKDLIVDHAFQPVDHVVPSSQPLRSAA